MKNFKYWLVIIVRTVVSALTFYILSMLFSSCEVKALSAGPSGYNNMYTNKGTRYSLSAGLETIDGVTYYLGHTKRGDITTLQFAIDNLSGTSNDYNVSFNIIVHGLLVKNPSVTINEYNSLNFGQSCTIVSENTSHSETDYTLYNANVTCSAISLSKNYMVTIGGFENITYGGISPSITYSQSTGNYDQKLDDVNDSINNVGDKVGDMNDTIKDSNTDEAQNSANGFFNGFEDNSHGLSGIVSSPLVLIKNFSSNSCTPVNIPILGKSATLPCGNTFFNQPGVTEFVNVFNIICGSLIAYGAFCGIRKKVEDFKNPDDSKVEVLDL